MLRDLKQHLQSVEKVSLFELCLKFNKDPSTLRCMLSHWIRKGQVCQVECATGCGVKCQTCEPAFTEIYAWVV